MALQVEGHGFSVTHGSLTITQNPTIVEIPGFSREDLDRTTQANTDVTTGASATLKTYEDFSHTYPFDPVDYEVWKIAATSTTGALHTVTFPASAGSFKIYATVKSLGTIAMNTGERPTYQVTFHPTNLNGSTETTPDFISGS